MLRVLEVSILDFARVCFEPIEVLDVHIIFTLSVPHNICDFTNFIEEHYIVGHCLLSDA